MLVAAVVHKTLQDMLDEDSRAMMFAVFRRRYSPGLSWSKHVNCYVQGTFAQASAAVGPFPRTVQFARCTTDVPEGCPLYVLPRDALLLHAALLAWGD